MKVIAIAGLVISACFLVVAIKLKTYVVHNIYFVFTVISLAGVFLGVKVVLALFTKFTIGVILQFVVGVFILWYIHKNIKRLAEQELRAAL